MTNELSASFSYAFSVGEYVVARISLAAGVNV